MRTSLGCLALAGLLTTAAAADDEPPLGEKLAMADRASIAHCLQMKQLVMEFCKQQRCGHRISDVWLYYCDVVLQEQREMVTVLEERRYYHQRAFPKE